MGIQNWSENIVLVNLAKTPNRTNELRTVTGMVTENGGFDVVIDFSDVEIVTSTNIAKLLKLHKAVTASGHRMVFSSVSPRVKELFTVVNLDSIFNFVDDKFVALAGLQMTACPV